LWQGEIVGGVVEYRVANPDEKVPTSFLPIDHLRTIVVTQDCDLLWDFAARTKGSPAHKLIEHVLLCDLFEEDEIRFRNEGQFNKRSWGRAEKNDDDRYHALPAASIGPTGSALPALHSDFKRVFSIPTDQLYGMIQRQQVTRAALVPVPYLQEYMYRLYMFLGRVAVPDANEEEGFPE